MIATAPALHWLTSGFKEALAMVWMTFWPLVLGFALSGVVQGCVPRSALRDRLGSDSPRSHFVAGALGALSSSCSYAASSMSRALFARGATWSNAMIFMVASTNLVIELAVVLAVLLGWPFVAAQIAGGLVMVVVLAALIPLAFRRDRVARLRARVDDQGDHRTPPASPSALERASVSARYTIGDLTMVRKELLIGFVVAGFISVHVPGSWWSHVFLHGHGAWTVLENVALAPLVSIIAFVCSVGNVPLAAALWGHGVAFGGVIAFLFADLVSFPLLTIYRRYYGAGAALSLLAVLWASASAAGLVVDVLFRVLGAVPAHNHVRVLTGDFPLGATLALNVAAAIVLLVGWRLARRDVSAHAAIDPICSMSVDPASAPAFVEHAGARVYFCSLGCRDKFLSRSLHEAGPARTHRDPVCHMVVGDDLSELAPDGVTYYFCGEGCRETFRSGSRPQDHSRE
ncbi:MAG TPA: permease [Acidimicrobiales bacterium]